MNKAFALSGRQVSAYDNPGCCPGLGAFALYLSLRPVTVGSGRVCKKRKGNQIGMNQLIALFTFVAMSNLVLSNYLSSSNPSEVFSRLQTLVKKSKRILRSSLFILHLYYPRYFIKILIFPLSRSLMILFSRIWRTRSRVRLNSLPISSNPFSWQPMP